MSLEQDFPRLAASGYKITGPATKEYNCIAWANGDRTRWWEPCPGYYWPPGFSPDYSVDTLASIFATLHRYGPCDEPHHEPGIEKVAIYGIDRKIWEHAARQLPDGRWTSKIGRNVEIEHNTVEALYGGAPGSEYGTVVRNMKRSPS